MSDLQSKATDDAVPGADAVSPRVGRDNALHFIAVTIAGVVAAVGLGFVWLMISLCSFMGETCSPEQDLAKSIALLGAFAALVGGIFTGMAIAQRRDSNVTLICVVSILAAATVVGVAAKVIAAG